MKSLGYEVVFALLNAADYGTAQVRHRFVFLGSRDHEFGSGTFRKMTGQTMTLQDLLPPTHHRLAPYSPIEPWRVLRDAIGGMPEPDPRETFTYSPERINVWKRIPAGRYWTYVRDNPVLFPEGLEALLKGAFSSGGGKVGFWRRLSWDKPSPTLPTQPQHRRQGCATPMSKGPYQCRACGAPGFPRGLPVRWQQGEQVQADRKCCAGATRGGLRKPATLRRERRGSKGHH